ncbi:MAG: NAD(P)-dependent alcohol dehydrogenase [Flavobacteriales bacterium]|nr:NAD(P)-dependent alcohol dehydrogenase [Flavobacteriales bacterium]
MKAACRFRYSRPDKLKIINVPVPEPGRREVLVKVHASTVNRTDCAVLLGKPLIMRAFTGLFRPRIPVTGTDFAGEVIQIGSEVSGFQKGDRVWGMNDNGAGSHAEYMSADSQKGLSKLPDGISYETAAASAEAAHYAYFMLRRMKIKPGTRVLVNGATGAIGSALIQFLHYEGAEVSAVCGKAHFERIRQLGVKELFDYQTQDFTESRLEFDYVIDAVGKRTFGACKKVLKRGGVYISSEPGPGWQNLFLALFTAPTKGKRVLFPVPGSTTESHGYIGRLLAEKRFQPLIDRSYSLDSIAEAFEYVLTGQKIGNVLLSFSDPFN